MHKKQSPLADKVVRIKKHVKDIGGEKYKVEDWWDRLGQGSWLESTSNFECMDYVARGAKSVPSPPFDEEVLYGKVGLYGKLVHVSEVEEID